MLTIIVHTFFWKLSEGREREGEFLFVGKVTTKVNEKMDAGKINKAENISMSIALKYDKMKNSHTHTYTPTQTHCLFVR